MLSPGLNLAQQELSDALHGDRGKVKPDHADLLFDAGGVSCVMLDWMHAEDAAA